MERAFEKLPNWPRLMSEPQAAAYLSIGKTTLRTKGPAPKREGRRVLYDRLDLDRWADRLGEQPGEDVDYAAECAEEERIWMERRRGKN